MIILMLSVRHQIYIEIDKIAQSKVIKKPSTVIECKNKQTIPIDGLKTLCEKKIENLEMSPTKLVHYITKIAGLLN